MASTTTFERNSPPALAIGSKPLILRFNDGDLQEPPKIMDPFDGGVRDATLELEMLKGKKCLACLEGEWLLMFDQDTNECFIVSLVSFSKISLPPLPRPVEELYTCAFSSPTPPDCTIMFTAILPATNHGDDDQQEDETCYLLYRRPGDDKWWGLYDDDDDDDERADDDRTYNAIDPYEILGSRGTMYVRTDMNTFIAIDASLSSSYKATIEKRGIPHPSTMRWGCKDYLVQSDGDVFLLQFYTHGIYNSEVIDMDIHCLDTSEYVWNKVESIGDRTVFVGDDNCVVLSHASRAGVRPGCVHLLHKRCHHGIRLYTIHLNDRTMSCSLLPASSESMYWVVPSSLKLTEEHLPVLSRKPNDKVELTFDEEAEEQVVAPWPSLPVDMFEELIPRISFIDYLNVRKVCKGWRSINKPIRCTERYPMLMSICSNSAGVFKLFDPIIDKEYTLKNCSLPPCSKYFQMLLFAKHGWILMMRDVKYMYAANPFTGEVFDFPELPWLGYNFDGISFSSAPKSPDCIVCAINKERVLDQARSNSIYVMVWRAGDKCWTQKEIDDHSQFRTAYSNPVFYHGEFYCLGTRGNLGVFDPENMTWRVLDKPEPILDGDPMPSEQYCYLLEFRDDLIAIFRPHDEGPIDLYRLDKSQMVWTKVERLYNEVIYVDNWNALMMPAPRDACCNRIYISKQGGYGRAGEAETSVFYDLKSQKYYPSYYGLTEQMNSIWVQPDFQNQ
ncbi:hypothetical protein EJB05_10443, partial [Eragrostis curvula]